MTTPAQQRAFWDRYDWSRGGEEWSASWGGTERLWREFIRPRIAPFLPTNSLLEIATGYGRITRYLLTECKGLFIGVDIVPACVSACIAQFGNAGMFMVNDGRSLPLVPDRSIRFAFSWDSLVHSDTDTIRAYVLELARVLRPGGAAFLHHSNMGWRQDWRGETHGRNRWMRAQLMREFARKAGLECSQEIIRWGQQADLDCLSTLMRP